MRTTDSSEFSRQASGGWTSPRRRVPRAVMLACVCVFCCEASNVRAQQSRSNVLPAEQNSRQAASRQVSPPPADPRLRAVLKNMTQQSKSTRSESSGLDSQNGDLSSRNTFAASPSPAPSSSSSRSDSTSSATRDAASSTWYRSADTLPASPPGSLEPLRSTPDSFGGATYGERLQEPAVSQFQTAEYTPEDEVTVDGTGTADSIIPATAKKTEMFLDLGDEESGFGSAASGGASASGDSNESSAEVSMASSPAHVIMRAVAWLVIALCLFSLAALGVRHWQRRKGLLPTTSSRSRVLETLSLGPGRSVSLIEISGYRAFVAFDTTGIKQLVLAPQVFSDTFADPGTLTDSGGESDNDELVVYTARAPDGEVPGAVGDS